MPCFALVDCNNFYVSCERLFRPDLHDKAVAVLSNNDGCIIARSEEVKALGIQMATPVHQVMPLIKQHRVALFSSNYSLYGDLSNRVMNTLAAFTPHLEIYSIDESFLTLETLPSQSLEEQAQAIAKGDEEAQGSAAHASGPWQRNVEPAPAPRLFGKTSRGQVEAHIQYMQAPAQRLAACYDEGLFRRIRRSCKVQPSGRAGGIRTCRAAPHGRRSAAISH